MNSFIILIATAQTSRHLLRLALVQGSRDSGIEIEIETEIQIEIEPTDAHDHEQV